MALYEATLTPYDKSLQLRTLIQHTNNLTRYWLLRYGFLVDSSERKEECPYAILALKEAVSEEAELRADLLQLRNLISILLESNA